MIGWLARRVAKRMIKDQTLFATSSDSAAMAEIFGTVPTASGVAVTPENAMQVSAVYACTRLLAGAVSSLPLETLRVAQAETTVFVRASGGSPAASSP